MRVVVQRCSRAELHIGEELKSKIGYGLVVLVGIEDRDGEEDVRYLAKKIAALRVFDDEAGVMNRSVVEAGGDILLVSQFTLMASTKKGNRPSYIRASRPEMAIPLYESLGRELEGLLSRPIAYGVFGADMQVGLVNAGPVTIIMDSHDRDF
ncbi:MAG: D-aminoacyl-tRNA deacylase [Porphyromonadaceae bacterium]|nr:D-aminoacyl-tRNA deacylase [Porphyromonadaceae bacterium]